MNLSEMQQKYRDHLINQRNEELEQAKLHIQNFKKVCSKRNIGLTDENFDFIQSIGVVATFPNLLFELLPILKKVDEDLLSFNQLDQIFKKKPLFHGLFWKENFVALAHPYFRRGLSRYGNFAPDFILEFWRYQPINSEMFIALDPNRVRINLDERQYLEADRWYGAEFNKNIALIKNGLYKGIPPSDIKRSQVGLLFNNALSLDLNWKEKNGIKTFELEELKSEEVTIEVDQKVYYPVRYIHAEYDIDKGFFRHFDGAIHLYTREEYELRKNSDLNFYNKLKKKIKAKTYKIFKINGEIQTKDWVNLTAHFCSGNPLILEYFNGELPESTQNIIDAIRRNQSL